MCEIWHLLQGVARVPSNEPQIVLGFLIKFKTLKPLWSCTKRQFPSKPSPAWFFLEPSFNGPGANRVCSSTIFIQIEKHGSHNLVIDFWVVSMHLLIQWPFTGHLLCASLHVGSGDAVVKETVSHLVEFAVWRGNERRMIIYFRQQLGIADCKKCYEGKAWGVMRPRRDSGSLLSLLVPACSKLGGGIIFFSGSIRKGLSRSHN